MALLTIGQDKQAVEAYGAVILRIIESANSDTVKTVALGALEQGIRIEGVHIEGCTFSVEKEEK